MADQPDPNATSSTPSRQLVLQKIYLRDLSYESPKAPEIFRSNATPQTQLNLRSSNRDLGSGNIEVTLTLTIESKDKDATIFLIEIAQAGVFFIEGYSQQERALLLGSFCPATLYPFAREAIADVVTKGGFPALLLQPINFDALLAQASKSATEQAVAAAVPQPPAEERH
jgi:preprotein translocase subunit SecB